MNEGTRILPGLPSVLQAGACGFRRRPDDPGRGGVAAGSDRATAWDRRTTGQLHRGRRLRPPRWRGRRSGATAISAMRPKAGLSSAASSPASRLVPRASTAASYAFGPAGGDRFQLPAMALRDSLHTILLRGALRGLGVRKGDRVLICERGDRVGDRAVVNQGNPLALPRRDMAVERVPAHIQPTAGEPAVERRLSVVEHAIPAPLPVDRRGGLGPEFFRMVERTTIDFGDPRHRVPP